MDLLGDVRDLDGVDAERDGCAGRLDTLVPSGVSSETTRVVGDGRHDPVAVRLEHRVSNTPHYGGISAVRV